MKKLISIALAIMLIMSLATVAFATETGTITVTNPGTDETYNIYKLLDLVDYDAGTDKYLYTVNAAWTGFFTAGTGALDYVTIETDGRVTWKSTVAKDEATVGEFAKLALDYAKTNSIAPTKVHADAATVEGKLVFSGLDLGYYLVDSSMGALCSLTTTKPTADVEEKNSVPTADKQVQEDDDGTWGETNTAGIGEKVNYKVTFNPGEGADNFIIRDTMSSGLTFNNDVAIEGMTKDTDFVVKTGTDAAPYTFTIEITDAGEEKLIANTDVTITYSATLNENAVTVNTQTNTLDVSYRNDPSVTDNNKDTPDDTTETTTFEFDVVKKDGQSGERLNGAVFQLSTTTGGTPINLIKTEVDGIPVYRPAKTGEVGTVNTIEPVNGLARVIGLDIGTYYLTEIVAPEGYNGLTLPKEFTITVESGSLVWADLPNNNYGDAVVVDNNTGSQLPTTGAMGTAMFVSFGTLVVLGTGVLLITKKRMSMIED